MTAPTTWAHLPNAKLIDWVLTSLAENPERWDAARDAAWDAARGAVRNAAWDAARGAARGAARDAARDAAWDAARGAARGAAWDAARGAARGAVSTFIADDDCAHLLDLDLATLRAMHALDGHFSSSLLQPAALVWKQK